VGQGMLAAGWHAHPFNVPGEFLISAPKHDIRDVLRARPQGLLGTIVRTY
jgi:hypothetical protein